MPKRCSRLLALTVLVLALAACQGPHVPQVGAQWDQARWGEARWGQ